MHCLLSIKVVDTNRSLPGGRFALQRPGSATLNARASISRSHAFLRRSLVTLQIAASIVLLSGAALLLHSFKKIEEQNLGLQTGGVVTVKVALPWFRYNSPQKSMAFYLNLESALRRLPGNRAVGITDSIPPGAVVSVADERGRFFGTALYSSSSQIAIRMIRLPRDAPVFPSGTTIFPLSSIPSSQDPCTKYRCKSGTSQLTNW